MTTIEKIQNYAHPLSVISDINGHFMPWNPNWKNPYKAENLIASGRTYGEMCKRFGKKAVNNAINKGKVMIADNKWVRAGEKFVSGMQFDVSRCSDDTPLIANGVCLG